MQKILNKRAMFNKASKYLQPETSAKNIKPVLSNVLASWVLAFRWVDLALVIEECGGCSHVFENRNHIKAFKAFDTPSIILK